MKTPCPRCGTPFGPAYLVLHLRGCFTTIREFVEIHEHHLTMDPATGCLFILREDGSIHENANKNRAPMSRAVLEAKLGRKLLPQPQEVACHTCDVPWCVNWFHLWVGSQSENLLDAYRKGRRRKVAPWRVQLGVHRVL